MANNEKQAEFQRNTFGAGGFQLVNNTDNQSGKFVAIQVCDGGAVFSSITQTNVAQISTSFTLPSGSVLYGSFITQFQLTSGTVLAYSAIEH